MKTTQTTEQPATGPTQPVVSDFARPISELRDCFRVRFVCREDENGVEYWTVQLPFLRFFWKTLKHHVVGSGLHGLPWEHRCYADAIAAFNDWKRIKRSVARNGWSVRYR